MAYAREKHTKEGRLYYEIMVSRGRGKSYATERWYPKEGWSKRVIERERNKAAADFERRVKNGEYLSRAEMAAAEAEQASAEARISSFKAYVETVYMPGVAARCSETTRTCYNQLFKNNIYPVIGGIKLPEVSPAQITALLVDMQASGKAHASCVKVYAVLNSVFKSAFLDDSIPVNPMLKVERPKPRKDEKDVSKSAAAYTIEEVKALFAALDTEPLKWRAYIRLLADTGIRRGEACGLKWSDIDNEDGYITISRNLCYTPDKGVYQDTPKSGKARIVPASPELLKLLKQLRSEQAKACMSEWVFSQDGLTDPMHPDSPTRYFKNIGKRCGMNELHPHKLRHTFASLAITNGADVASVSETLGHSDKAVTLRMYTHADEESKKRAASIVWNAINE
ncbi:MAG: site-specific integrase [Clostridia bacterium]|nr:site-specific integrase [Clostridia bacterium]